MEYQQYLHRYVAFEPVLARRCWAALLDYCTYFALVFLYGYFFGEVVDWGFSNGGFLFHVKPGLLGLLTIWIVYFPLMESMVGYTLFKGLFDLKVVCERKGDFPFFVTLKRHLCDVLDFAFLGLVAILLVKFSVNHKRLGDYFARSRVVLDVSAAEGAP